MIGMIKLLQRLVVIGSRTTGHSLITSPTPNLLSHYVTPKNTNSKSSASTEIGDRVE